MDSYLQFLISPLLSEPTELTIAIGPNTITIKVAPADTGKVIGKHGSTIHAIRTLFKTYCALHNLPPISLNLDSPPKSSL